MNEKHRWIRKTKEWDKWMNEKIEWMRDYVKKITLVVASASNPDYSLTFILTEL